MDQTPAPKPSRERDRLECESWLLDARVVERTVERLEAEAAIHDIDVVERLAMEEVLEAVEVIADVITSPLNPVTWIKLVLKGSLRIWRAFRGRRRRRRRANGGR